jgi:hypothetical protein
MADYLTKAERAARARLVLRQDRIEGLKEKLNNELVWNSCYPAEVLQVLQEMMQEQLQELIKEQEPKPRAEVVAA